MVARRLPLVVAFALALSSASGDELVIAREALRDGLWDVARTHAAKSEDPAARVVIAESFAREGKWKELIETIVYGDKHHELRLGLG